MYLFMASGIGSLLAVMILFNSLLSQYAGQALSILVLHIVGLATASMLLPFNSPPVKTDRKPLYLYLAGALGVFLVFSNNICFVALGASLTLSLVILGQTLGSVITDSFGLLGMAKHPLQRRKLVGLAIIIAGIILMIERMQFHPGYISLALGTGMVVVVIMILNSQLALRVGIFKGALFNYSTGLLTILAVILLTGADLSSARATLSGIHPLYIFGGGVTGVFAVAGINVVFPKIPTLYSTILLFSGQILTGVGIDFIVYDIISLHKPLGALVVLAGLFYSLLPEKKGRTKTTTPRTLQRPLRHQS